MKKKPTVCIFTDKPNPNKPHYKEAMEFLIDKGWITSDREKLFEVMTLHDDSCKVYEGGNCNCNPTIQVLTSTGAIHAEFEILFAPVGSPDYKKLIRRKIIKPTSEVGAVYVFNPPTKPKRDQKNSIMSHEEAKELLVNEISGGIPRRTLLWDGEATKEEWRENLKRIARMSSGMPLNNFIAISSTDYDEEVNFCLPKWQKILNDLIDKHQIEVLTLNDVHTLFKHDGIDHSLVVATQNWLKHLSEKGVKVIINSDVSDDVMKISVFE